MVRFAFVLVFSVCAVGPFVDAQDQADRNAPDVQYDADAIYDPDEPVPYQPDEFSPWAYDLRRGEIIAIGAFPLAMIVSSLTYELGRFAYRSAEAGTVSGEYAPWFFSTSTEETFSNEERIGLVLSSAVISVGVAVADFFLGRREARREEQRRE